MIAEEKQRCLAEFIVDGERRRIAWTEELHRAPYSGKMPQMKDADARALLRDLFDAALAAARPATCLAPISMP